MSTIFASYAERLTEQLSPFNWDPVLKLGQELFDAWHQSGQVFLCGYGGSAGNAVHLANDFLYGVSSHVKASGLRVEALSANSAVLTCLANDIGYDEVFAEQIKLCHVGK